MVYSTAIMTAAEFDRYALLPINLHRRLEFHNGRLIELVSNSKSSRLGARLLSRVDLHASDNHLGWVTGADGGYIVNGNRYIPDAAFVSNTRQPEPPDVAYNPLPPDLAIEVISPSDDRDELADKVQNYLAAGVVVWVADLDVPSITVHVPGHLPVVLQLGDTLDGGHVLPGVKVPVAEIFAV